MRNRNKPWIKNIKDYMAPIWIFLLILFLVYLAFSGDSNEEPTNETNTEQSGAWVNDLSLTISEWTQAVIINEKDKKSDVWIWSFLSPWETLTVQNGDVWFEIDNIASMVLATNWELQYLPNSKMKLDSASLWVNAMQNIEIETRYLNAKLWSNSIANFEQNEVWSTIYLMEWTAEVSNLAWQTTFLSKWKKIQITSQEASQDDLDLTELKSDFDTYFKLSDWYLKNINGKWTSQINTDTQNTGSDEINLNDLWTTIDDSTTTPPNTVTDKSTASTIWLLNFDTIYDEWSVNSASTTITWNFTSTEVGSIYINDIKATINTATKVFSVPSVNTGAKSNDLIIKVLDTSENVIWKYLYTVYYSGWAEATGNTNTFSNINTESYPVNDSDFIISTPTIKNGVTYLDENPFYGTVKNPNVASVYINWFKLTTFNWSTFRYYAYKRFSTLWEWVNNYEIRYVAADGTVILKKYISFSKLTATPTSAVVEPSNPALISTEANL